VKRGIPLSGLITGVVLVLIVATTGAVGVSGFRAARRTVDDLWRQLADNLAERTTGETLRFLDAAEPLAELSVELFEAGVLDPDRPEQLLSYLTHALEAHPEATWISWGDARDGRFYGAYRALNDDDLPVVRRTVRHIVSPGRTRYIDEERGEFGWLVVSEHEGEKFYDPRTRPWFIRVADRPSGEGAWVDPYLFSQAQQPGVTYAAPVHDRDGELLGVFCVDFEMAPLSAFLSRLEVGRTGRAYLLTSAGQVIGHPEGSVVHREGDEAGFWDASEHPDTMLATAWSAWLAQGRPTEPFTVGELLAVAMPFPADSGIPWSVLMVVPADDLLGHARGQARQSAVLAVLAIGLALLLGLLLSRAVARSVTQIRTELLSIARFEISESPLESSSPIREINDMGEATEVMKQGLRAFARYVPHQLVRHLLASGREAQLGAERREMSVLFSDIAGFTTVVESNEPEVVLAALGAYLDGMNDAISSTLGTVCQYLGDGIMAFWGAPEVLDDHAVRVCRGALAMQAHADALLADAERSGAPRLPTRIGIDSGEVMVGNIGAHERFNYGILGDTVNATARKESLNKVYGTRILAGARTAELAADHMVFRAVDLVLLKGKRTPSRVYELVGEQGMVDPQTLALIDAYERGLALYLDGQFVDALAAFERSRTLQPDDGPTAIMIARCHALIAEPPEGPWDGVTVLAHK
jgi:adenylate cyclase